MSAEREALAAICSCYPKNSNAHRIASQALANPATINRLASSTPAAPREASGYCPYCMAADPGSSC